MCVSEREEKNGQEKDPGNLFYCILLHRCPELWNSEKIEVPQRCNSGRAIGRSAKTRYSGPSNSLLLPLWSLFQLSGRFSINMKEGWKAKREMDWSNWKNAIQVKWALLILFNCVGLKEAAFWLLWLSFFFLQIRLVLLGVFRWKGACTDYICHFDTMELKKSLPLE